MSLEMKIGEYDAVFSYYTSNYFHVTITRGPDTYRGRFMFGFIKDETSVPPIELLREFLAGEEVVIGKAGAKRCVVFGGSKNTNIRVLCSRQRKDEKNIGTNTS